MLTNHQLEQAISIHERSYRLLKWVAEAMKAGFIPATHAHSACTGGEAARAWIEHHYCNLPIACRPAQDEMVPFANFFASYLEASFDIVVTSPHRNPTPYGCGCNICCRIATASHLIPKPVTAQEKKRAAKLRLRRMEMLAREQEIALPCDAVVRLANGDRLRDAALSAYGASLIERINGASSGLGVLALWREIAWRKGSPDREFHLTTESIITAERRLVSAMQNTQALA